MEDRRADSHGVVAGLKEGTGRNGDMLTAPVCEIILSCGLSEFGFGNRSGFNSHREFLHDKLSVQTTS